MFALGLVIGLFLGATLTVAVLVLRLAERPITGRHAAEVLNPQYPRRIARPVEFTQRVLGRPTNVDEPPATIRPAQFRRRKQTGENE
jgi:hypothetical protein